MKKAVIILIVFLFALQFSGCGVQNGENGASIGKIEKIISGMTLDEKISQMIIPAVRDIWGRTFFVNFFRRVLVLHGLSAACLTLEYFHLT